MKPHTIHIAGHVFVATQVMITERADTKEEYTETDSVYGHGPSGVRVLAIRSRTQYKGRFVDTAPEPGEYELDSGERILVEREVSNDLSATVTMPEVITMAEDVSHQGTKAQREG